MPVNYANLQPVSPYLTGVMCTTRPKLADQLIGRALLPRVQVEAVNSTGTIFVDTAASFLGSPQGLERAPGAPMASSTSADPTSVTYSCKIYSKSSHPIPQEIIKRSQLPEDLGVREAEKVQNDIALAEENRIATLLFTAGNWTGTSALTAVTNGSTAKFSNAAAGKPMNDIPRAIEMFRLQAFGTDPTDIVIGRQVAEDLKVHPEVRGLYLVTSGAGAIGLPANDEALKAIFMNVFGVRLWIGKARGNTAADGQAASYGYIWTDSMWIGCLQPVSAAGSAVYGSHTAALGIDEMTAIVETGNAAISNLSGIPMIAGFDVLSPTQGNAIVVYGQQQCTEKVLSADLGFLVTDCN